MSADAVLPMVGGELIRNGGVAVDGGKIVRVGTVEELRREFGDYPWEHMSGVMLPGLVNAHVHLELTELRGKLPAGDFVEWVKSLLLFSRRACPPFDVGQNVRTGVEESLRFGVTCVGDITRHVASAREILREGQIRAVSFGEVIGIGMRREGLVGRIAVCGDKQQSSETLGIGISPHAPYTVEGPALAAIVASGLPVAMHLAELAEEREFLQSLGGRLRELWGETANFILDERIPRFEGGPIRWAQQYGLFEAAKREGGGPVLLAHVNYCDDAELAILAESKCSVAYCPRTREFFGHEQRGKHRYQEMLEAGINVCLGTDSLASNPDLSVLAEAALLHRRDGISATTAMEMITWRGAEALGVQVGKLAPGHWADILVMPVEMDAKGGQKGRGDSTDKVLERVLLQTPEPHGLWVAGRRVR